MQNSELLSRYHADFRNRIETAERTIRDFTDRAIGDYFFRYETNEQAPESAEEILNHILADNHSCILDKAKHIIVSRPEPLASFTLMLDRAMKEWSAAANITEGKIIPDYSFSDAGCAAIIARPVPMEKAMKIFASMNPEILHEVEKENEKLKRKIMREKGISEREAEKIVMSGKFPLAFRMRQEKGTMENAGKSMVAWEICVGKKTGKFFTAASEIIDSADKNKIRQACMLVAGKANICKNGEPIPLSVTEDIMKAGASGKAVWEIRNSLRSIAANICERIVEAEFLVYALLKKIKEALGIAVKGASALNDSEISKDSKLLIGATATFTCSVPGTIESLMELKGNVDDIVNNYNNIKSIKQIKNSINAWHNDTNNGNACECLYEYLHETEWHNIRQNTNANPGLA